MVMIKCLDLENKKEKNKKLKAKVISIGEKQERVGCSMSPTALFRWSLFKRCLASSSSLSWPFMGLACDAN